eukprot:scaffold28835_cov63-Phaeocystis_antarctica.AAC.6
MARSAAWRARRACLNRLLSKKSCTLKPPGNCVLQQTPRAHGRALARHRAHSPPRPRLARRARRATAPPGGTGAPPCM